nr:pyridoxal phosphate-dependent transferase [Tanacetum cinerariifolium]
AKVVTASLGFPTNFKDVYKLWVSVANFLDRAFIGEYGGSSGVASEEMETGSALGGSLEEDLSLRTPRDAIGQRYHQDGESRESHQLMERLIFNRKSGTS